MALVAGKGGARHFSKPRVDADILFKILSNHSDLLSDLGPYENVSRTQACNPNGLVHVLGLVRALVQAEKSCEIHQSNLRAALTRAYQQNPAVNRTKFNGGVWVGMKVERLGVILCHMRRLKNAETDLRTCAARLTSAELIQLQDVLGLIDKKSACPPALDTADKTLAERDSQAKRLKKEVSDVSVDAEGFPKCWLTPKEKKSVDTGSPLSKGEEEPCAAHPLEDAEEEPCAAHPLAKAEAAMAQPLKEPSFLRKRLGSKAHAKPAAPPPGTDLKIRMGFVSKKPAALAKRAKKRPSAQQDVTAASEPSSGARLPWLKLKKVNATKPERQYVTGTKEPGSKKLKLVVEVTKKRSSKFAQHIDTIMSKMRTNHLTKEEALQLKEDLCQQD
ncbi:unnamed protein product [Effrenium voratum]|nr:unnamed protein product [Effrenium voratum]